MSAKKSSKNKATKVNKAKTVRKPKEPGFDDFHLLGVLIDDKAKHIWRFALIGSQFALLILTLVTMSRFYGAAETTAIDFKFIEFAIILNVVLLVVSAISKHGSSFAITTLMEILFFIICLITPAYTVEIGTTDPDCPQCDVIIVHEARYNVYGITPIGDTEEQ